MVDLLDSVLSILPVIQAKNIKTTLNDLKLSGQIRNAEEYRSQLEELSLLINSNIPKPFFSTTRSLIWDTINSNTFNNMISSSKKDIESLFLQLEEMDSKLQDHNDLFLNYLIKDLEKLILSQESFIKKLEWISDESNEFSIIQHNSFNLTDSFSSFSNKENESLLYFNNRTSKSFVDSDIKKAKISEYGEKLILPNQTKIITPISVKTIIEQNSYSSVLDNTINNNITNILDGKKGTYWSRPIYLNSPVNKVSTLLLFDLGLAKDINYICIESGSETPIIIEEIYTFDSNSSIINLISTSIICESNKRIDFNRIFTQKVFVKISINTYNKVDFINSEESNTNLIYSNTLDEQVKSSIKNITNDIITSPRLKNILGIVPPNRNKENLYLYSLIIDNIYFGDSTYSEYGLFLSSPLKVSNLNICALSVSQNENNNSIEYEIIKQDNFPNYKETKIAIPFLNQDTVINEKLIFINKTTESSSLNIASLRLCPLIDLTNSISVFKDNSVLRIGIDYEISFSEDSGVLLWSSSYSNARDYSLYNLLPTKVFIKILNINPLSSYTANYKIKKSNDLEGVNIWMDKDKLVQLTNDNKLFFRQDDIESVISNLYLQITLRRTSNLKHSSSEVYDYTLLAGTND